MPEHASPMHEMLHDWATNRELLRLASEANEAVIAFREEAEMPLSALGYDARAIIRLAGEMAAKVDALTGAIVEAANQ